MAGRGAVRRRRLIAAASALLAIAGIALIVLRPGAAAPPADTAAALVPADALVYVHLSTDPDRAEDDELRERLEKLPAFRRLRDQVAQAVGTQGGIDLDDDVRPWLGDEAAFALLPSEGTVAPSLLLLAVKDRAAAQRLIERGRATGEHRGVELRSVGTVTAAFAGDFLALGQLPAVEAAIDRAQERGAALATSAPYLAAAKSREDDRVLEMHLSPEGVRRVLRPQGGVIGAIGGALDHPALRAASLTLAPADGDGIRVVARSARTKSDSRPFKPQLLDQVPDGAYGYIGLGGLDGLSALLPRAGTQELLARARAALPDDAGVDLDRDVLEPLRGEIALHISTSLPIPEVTLTARTRDERKTREALGRLQGVLAEALGGVGEGEGAVPTFEERRLDDGITAYAVTLGPGFELLYAVFDGRLVISSTAAGIERARDPGDSLRDDERFERAVGDVPERAEALLFLDLRQLLTLGELAGLTASGPLQTARDDLRRIRTVGAAARREGNDTIAEFFLEIP